VAYQDKKRVPVDRTLMDFCLHEQEVVISIVGIYDVFFQLPLCFQGFSGKVEPVTLQLIFIGNFCKFTIKN